MKLNCELTQDLLPLYAEGMLKEGNRKLVQEHLDTCESCRSLLGDIERPAVHVEPHDDGLKGFRKKLRRHNFTVGAVSAFVTILIAILIWSCFLSGSDALGLAFIAFIVVLPLIAMACGLVAGLRSSRSKWVVPAVCGLVTGLLPLITVQYTDSSFFVLPFVFALIGTVIGHIVHLVRARKQKKAA